MAQYIGLISKFELGITFFAQNVFPLRPDPKDFCRFRKFEFLNPMVLFFVVKKPTFLFELFVAPRYIALYWMVISVNIQVLKQVPALAEHAATEIALESAEAQVVQRQVSSQDQALRIHFVAVW